MSIVPIFLGDITYNPLQGPAPKHGPPADWTWPHGAPRPTPCPAGAAAPRARPAHPSSTAGRRRRRAVLPRRSGGATRPGHPVKQGRCGIDPSASILPVLVALSSRGFSGGPNFGLD